MKANGQRTGREPLTREEIFRYSRHLIMPEVGLEGQERLKNARVLCIGTGGLGSPISLYLAAAGVGRLGLVDFDKVDTTNLQRQVLFAQDAVGRPKVEAARERLQALNPLIAITTYDLKFTSENALGIMGDYDVIVDGTDNFQTRYLTNDAGVLLKKPVIYGSIFQFEGQVSVFDAERGPCYRCLFPSPPPPGLVPSCAEGGVLGVLPGVIGTIQATEAVKLVLGKGEPLIGRLLLFDALQMSFREVKLRKRPDCPACGAHPTVTGLMDYDEFCGIRGGGAEGAAMAKDEVTVGTLKEWLDRQAPVTLIDVREPYEHDICQLEGARLMPLGTLPQRLTELDTATEYVVFCRSGVRSRQAVEFLKSMGFQKAKNLKGGILAWADQIDPSLPRY